MRKVTLAATGVCAVWLGCASAVVAQTPQRPLERSERGRALPSYRTGWELMRAESWPEAARAFEQAIDIDPQFELAFYGLGQAHMAQKRYVDATTAYLHCRDLYRARSGQQFVSAQDAQRYRQERLTELDQFIAGLQSGPQTLQNQERLRQAQDLRRRLWDSIQQGNSVSIENTVPAFVSVALGSAYFRSEKFADAEQEYKAALQADPKSGEAHNNLAVVYFLSGRLNEAEREIKAAEKAGFKVQPQLKVDIQMARKSEPDPRF
jgi:Tfp pilus assembly protein PilF